MELAGRDELVVTVPLFALRQLADLPDRLGDEPEAWPWNAADVAGDLDRRIRIAAATLALSRPTMSVNDRLLSALRVT